MSKVNNSSFMTTVNTVPNVSASISQMLERYDGRLHTLRHFEESVITARHINYTAPLNIFLYIVFTSFAPDFQLKVLNSWKISLKQVPSQLIKYQKLEEFLTEIKNLISTQRSTKIVSIIDSIKKLFNKFRNFQFTNVCQGEIERSQEKT